MNLPRPLHRWLLSAVALAVIYVNLAVIFHPGATRRKHPALPLHPALYDAFLIFGVFSYYETNNHEMQLWGDTGKTNVGIGGWKLLDAHEHFPFTRGERDGRIWASRHYRALPRSEHLAVWQRTGLQILQRHNRLHPDEPILRLGIQNVSWPRSPEGFYAAYVSNRARYTFWTVATNQ
jgi:hypothetical protein